MRSRLLLCGVTAGLGLATVATPLLADQFHYNNVLVGTRAMGMGGAFAGIADDASGIYYNPGGLAFALSNDIQGSANAFYGKNTVYKKALGSTDFTEESSGSLTPFFGGLQKLDRYVQGLVAAFGVYYTDGDLKDQDTPIDQFQIGSTVIDRYHRTSNARASTYFAGAGVGYRILNNLGIGLGVSYFNADELVQEFQYAKQSLRIKLSDGSSVDGWSILASNIRQHLAVYGMQPTLGVQVALPSGFTAGLTVKKIFVASQSLETASDISKTLVTDTQNSAATKNGPSTTVANPIQNTVTKQVTKSTNPVGDLPLEARVGVAWFASSSFVWSLDLSYHDGVTDADVKTDPNAVRAAYAKEAIVNLATGVEWYVTPSFPLRFGVFTNNDARPELKKGTADAASGQTCSQSLDYYKKYCAQPDHIDYYGGSLFIAWVQPNSQIAAGITLQSGNGKAQKLGDDAVQEVKSNQYSFAFSATHNM
jgi:long-chain fatty acid transport protein